MENKRMSFRRSLSVLLGILMLLTVLPHSALASLTERSLHDGSYIGTGEGRNGDVVLSVTLSDGSITEIEAVSQNETPYFWNLATAMFDRIITANSPEVDTVSGATISSNAIKAAVRDALSKADDAIPGTGTEEDPFVISSAIQLIAFAEKVDAGEAQFVSAYAVLGADVDLSATGSFNPIGQEGKANTNAGRLFAGHFDGMGHTISNLTIEASYDNEANVGLFSTLAETARISNVRLENVTINVSETGSFANVRAGGVAGDTARTSGTRAAIIDGCTVSGSVTVNAADGQGFAGGILGRAFTKSAVINCVADAEVSAITVGGWNTAYAGGIVGSSGSNVVIANNAAFGSVYAENLSGGSDAYAGGIAGMLTGKLYNCYALVSAGIAQMNGVSSEYVGAIGGQDSYASGAYNYYSGSAVLTVADENGNETGVDPRPWYMNDAGGLVTAEAVTADYFASADLADLLNGNIPTVNAALNEDALALRRWALTGGRVILADRVWEEEAPDPDFFASGSGTENDPWIIMNKAQLMDFAASVSADRSYVDKYICLGADIDISGCNWEPIGCGSIFDGSFDGAEHTISGLTEGSADTPRELDASNDCMGLFAELGEHAVIKDLALTDISIHTHSTGSAYIGAIAARMSGSDIEGNYTGALIDGCIVNGSIEHTTDAGTSFLGGVCGHMFKGAVINTSTEVDMQGFELSGELVEIGGIAGLVNRGLIANCYTLGSIIGSAYREVEQDIEGMACIGGVAGVNGGYIVNCYSDGDVTALEYSIDTGILAGWVTGIAKVYNSWYNENAQMTIDGREVEPVDPFGEIVPGGVSDEYGFHFPGGLVYNIEAYLPGADDAIRLADGLNASFAAFPIDISGIYGLSEDALLRWTVENDRAVPGEETASVVYERPQIEDDIDVEPDPAMQDGIWYGRSEDKSTLVMITVEDGAIVDTTVISGEASGDNYDFAIARAKFKATFGDNTDYSQMDLTGFAGSGTENDPYLIETADQLRSLAEQIDEDVDFFGLYFKQTCDLDLSDDDWFPIGWGIFADVDGDGFGQDLAALYPFRGHYDGANHVITGLHVGTEAAPVSGSFMGLFGVIQGDYTTNEIPENGTCASIMNVRLENVSIITENRWRSYAGGLVGNAQGGFVIDNCSVTGNVGARSTVDFAMAGGLAGSLMYGLVSDSRTNAEVNAWSGTNYSYAGGIAALTNRATIINSYTLGNVHADADQTNRAEAGGFIGLAGGVCVNCYAMGNVEAVSKFSMYIGGFVGMAAASSEFRQCYYNVDADQLAAGNSVAEKRFAGKFVYEATDAEDQAKTAEELASEAFRDLMEANRTVIADTLAEIGDEFGTDENGSSAYQSIYYHGHGNDLNEWILLEDHVGFAETNVLLGDVDGDGEITALDALMIMRYALGLIDLNGDALKAADWNGDGEITANDALNVMRVAMGIYSR